MGINILFALLFAFIIIRTIAYGVYSIRNTGITGGISVFALSAAVIAASYILLFTDRGI